MNRDEILDKAARAMHDGHAPLPPRDAWWIARSVAMYRARFATGLDAVESDIRADERAQLAAGDTETCAGWLRYTLDTLGVAAGRSDDLAEELATLVGSFVEMKLRHERARIATWLRREHYDALGHMLNGNQLAELIEKGTHHDH